MLLTGPLDADKPFPKLERRLRLGVVGGGRVASMQAAAARLSDHWDIVAGAFSSDPERAKSAAGDWRLPLDRCYLTFEEMARAESRRDDGVDAVMITTPNHMHHDCSLAFLHNGIHVLCDKPMTNTISDALALVDAVEETGCIFGVSYVMSCFAMVRQAQKIVQTGGIGRITQIHVEFMQDWMTPADVAEAPHVKWRLDPAKSGRTSCVGDIGTHAAHLAQFVSGHELKAVRADFHVCGAPKPLEDTAFMNLRFSDNIPGTLMCTRLAPGNRGGLRLRVYGTEGGVEWDLENSEQLRLCQIGMPDQILSRGHGHGIGPSVERLVRTARGFPEGIIEAWANLYTEFAISVAAKSDGKSIPKGYLGLPSVRDGANGVGFIEASANSAEANGAWMEISEPEN